MWPRPRAVVPMPRQAMPAPRNLAASASIWGLLLVWVREKSVARMKGVVEVKAGEDGEDVRLQRGDENLERGEGDGGEQRQDGAEHADEAERAERHHEAGEHLERDVTRQHVGEQTDRQADRPRQERQDL